VTPAPPLLEARHLRKYYPVRRGWGRTSHVAAVDDVSFQLNQGETLGLVGESGCGKTTTGLVILRLVPATAGEVLFRTSGPCGPETQSLLHLSARRLRPLRRRLQVIFQDPYSSLNPRLTVGATLEEGLIAHRMGSRAERRRRVGELLERVGLDRGASAKYPHAFSGGQRQRIGIARALAVEPDLIVCDEPVSALDVSVQAQVLNLLLDLQRERQLAYLFIAHDLAVVARVADRVAVMYRGQIVETAPRAVLYGRPAHPYTRMLLAAAPPDRDPGAPPLPAAAPTPVELAGCRFRPRCPEARPECARVEPPLVQLGGGHEVRCHLWTAEAAPPAG
jgi:peptide/nickel transport system ATP-binding protein/oligopeptide transport system ATP-binding protein